MPYIRKSGFMGNGSKISANAEIILTGLSVHGTIFVMILMLYIGENLMTSILPYIIIFYGVDKTKEMTQISNEGIIE